MQDSDFVLSGALFDGSLSFPIGTPQGLGLYDQDFTIEMWIQASSLSTDVDSPLLGSVTGTGNRESLHLLVRSRKLYMDFNGGGTSGSTVLENNTWYHVAWRYQKSTSTQTIYLNGVEEASSGGHPSLLGTAGISLGAWTNAVSNFKGFIDEVRVWKVARSQAQIQADISRRLTGSETDLTAYYALDAQSGMVTELAGTSGTIAIASSDTLGLVGSDLTVEVWLHAKDLSASDYAVLAIPEYAESLNLKGLHLLLRNRKPYIGFYGTGNDLSGNTTLSSDTWYHIAWRYHKATQTQSILVNGVSDGTGTSRPALSAGAALCIGQYAGGSRFKGQLAELRIWKTARTDDEIRTNLRRRLHGTESGLVGYFPLTTSHGAVSPDRSVMCLHGQISAAVTQQRAGLLLSPAKLPASQHVFDVLNLNGKDGGVALPAITSDASSDLSRGFGIEAWIYLRKLSPWTRVIELWTSGHTDKIALFASCGSGPGLEVYVGDTAFRLEAPTALPTGQWLHLCGTLDDTATARIYLDGVEIARKVLALPRPQSRTQCYIGKPNDSASYLDALVSEVRLWKRARTIEEIQAARSIRLLGSESDLVGSWRLADGSGGVAKDASKNRLDGKLQGGASWERLPMPVMGWCAGLGSVSHEGKVVVLAMGHDGVIRYAVKQSGFEDSAILQTTLVPGWEDWRELPLPDEEDDTSVTAKEQAELTVKNNPSQYLLRSRYRTRRDHIVAPVQAISGLGHVYVFRQSKANTLYCDRFVLNGLDNTLVRKLEVRFKRSEKRHEPKSPASSSGGQVFDSLDFSSSRGVYFFEPTTELSRVAAIHPGRFAVVLLPTLDLDCLRWHVFTHNTDSQCIECFAIRSSRDGLFDVRDHLSIDDGRQLAGVIRTRLTLAGMVVGGPSATSFDLQEEKLTDEGKKQLLRTGMRVMLTVPTTGGAAVLVYSVTGDGLLSELVQTAAAPQLLRAEEQSILLPLNSLDEVRTVGVTPTKSGQIARIDRSDDDLVRIKSNTVHLLEVGDVVELKDTRSYDGLYAVTVIDADTFEINAVFQDSAIGRWEQIKSVDTGEFFDGAITSYEKHDDKLRVTAFNHGLAANETVQILGSEDHSGIYPIVPIDADNFAIDRRFAVGQALNVRMLAAKRRGLRLRSAQTQYVRASNVALPTGCEPFTIEAWIRLDALPTGSAYYGIASWGPTEELKYVSLVVRPGNDLAFSFFHADLVWNSLTNLVGGWHHIAATYDGTTRRLFVDGNQLGSDAPGPILAVPASTNIVHIGTANGASECFNGVLADVRIYKRARSAEQIRLGMHLTLSGLEADLIGYWPLGALIEGSPRTVPDLSIDHNHGVVHGGACMSGKLLSRQPVGWTQAATRYVNEDLISVTQGMTYKESFEYKLDAGNADALYFSYWGKRSRDTEQIIAFPPSAVGQTTHSDVSGDPGWRRAECTFTVPDGVALLRLLEVKGLSGTWNTIELRKHSLQAQPAALSEQSYSATPSLASLGVGVIQRQSDLVQLDHLEKQLGALLIEKADIEARILQLSDLVKLQGKINELTTLIGQLTGLIVGINDKLQNPTKYDCKLIARHSSKVLDVVTDGPDAGQLHTWPFWGGT